MYIEEKRFEALQSFSFYLNEYKKASKMTTRDGYPARRAALGKIIGFLDALSTYDREHFKKLRVMWDKVFNKYQALPSL